MSQPARARPGPTGPHQPLTWRAWMRRNRNKIEQWIRLVFVGKQFYSESPADEPAAEVREPPLAAGCP